MSEQIQNNEFELLNSEISPEKFDAAVEAIINAAPLEIAMAKEPSWYRVGFYMSDTRYVAIDVPTMHEMAKVEDSDEDDMFFDVSDQLIVRDRNQVEMFQDGRCVVYEVVYMFNLLDNTSLYEEKNIVIDREGKVIRPETTSLDLEEGLRELIERTRIEYELGNTIINQERYTILMDLISKLN